MLKIDKIKIINLNKDHMALIRGYSAIILSYTKKILRKKKTIWHRKIYFHSTPSKKHKRIEILIDIS